MGRELRSWRGVASVVWVVLLIGWFILTTNDLVVTTDLAVWMALVIVQMMIWGFVAYINLGIYSGLREQAGRVWKAVGFVLAVLVAVALPLGVASIHLGAEIIGSAESSYVAVVLQLAAFVSVVPALLVLYTVRSISADGRGEIDAEAVRSNRSLRRAIRPAVASLGVTLAVGIIATGFTRDAIAEVSDSFEIEPQHVLLYGGFFTGVVFALYVYAKSAVDTTAQQMVDEAVPVVGLDPGDDFLAREKARADMEDALGLGVNSRESFQSLVVVASPLLGAILTTFVVG